MWVGSSTFVGGNGNVFLIRYHISVRFVILIFCFGNFRPQNVRHSNLAQNFSKYIAYQAPISFTVITKIIVLYT